MAVTPPHAGIQSVAELYARGRDFVWEVAAWAKTKIKRRGLRAPLSEIEIAAMAASLDVVVEDHPDFPGGDVEPAEPTLAQVKAGTEL